MLLASLCTCPLWGKTSIFPVSFSIAKRLPEQRRTVTHEFFGRCSFFFLPLKALKCIYPSHSMLGILKCLKREMDLASWSLRLGLLNSFFSLRFGWWRSSVWIAFHLKMPQSEHSRKQDIKCGLLHFTWRRRTSFFSQLLQKLQLLSFCRLQRNLSTCS